MNYQQRPSGAQEQQDSPSIPGYPGPLLGMTHAGIAMGQHHPQSNVPNVVNANNTMIQQPNISHENEMNVAKPTVMNPAASQIQISQQTNQQPQQQQREVNTASLCRIGQEIVQEIIVKTTDVFQLLKILQLPSGAQQNMEEIKVRVQDHLNSIKLLFKRLRLIYNKCNEDCAGMEYTLVESLIPMKDDNEYNKFDEKKSSEVMKLISEEYRETSEQVIMKNRQLKEVIDHMRDMIWEINTMLAMRKP